MFTDGAATSGNTSAPVFSSASYNFVAGDVGAWVFIGAGTNWAFGWFKIVSVAANAATLEATIGLATTRAARPTTVVGCATVASPNNATWAIDYSQQSAARFTYTDLISAGAGLTVSSAAKPFAKQHVGNALVITGGTNFTAGRYVIVSVAASVATVVGPGNITTGIGVSGTGGMGGALASPGLAGSVKLNQHSTCIKAGTYSITSATPNISGGCVSDATGSANAAGTSSWEGYSSVRGDLGTAPILQASGISTATLFLLTGAASAGSFIANLTADGAGLTSIKGISLQRSSGGHKLRGINCTNVGLDCASARLTFCAATNITGGAAALVVGAAAYCEAYGNTVPGISASGALAGCLATGNTGASSHGFVLNGNVFLVNCVAYGNGGSGFSESNTLTIFINCLAEGNGAWGFTATSSGLPHVLFGCGGYNNTSGNFTYTVFSLALSFVNGAASFFVDAAAGNFALNTLPTGGALARATGFPGAFPRGTTVGYQDLGAAQHWGVPLFGEMGGGMAA